MQERPYGATDEAANQTSKPPSLQTSNLPANREGAGGRRGPSPPDRPHPLRLRGKEARRRSARTLCVFAPKKEPPGGGSFWGWGKAHCAGVCAGRLTFTPSVTASPATEASGTVNVTVSFSPTVAEASAAGAPFTVRV